LRNDRTMSTLVPRHAGSSVAADATATPIAA
jgi:hypothetical protein